MLGAAKGNRLLLEGDERARERTSERSRSRDQESLAWQTAEPLVDIGENRGELWKACT